MSFAFTRDFGMKVNRILTVASVRKPGIDPSTTLAALWDTGATSCVINDAKAKMIGLPVVGKAVMNHAGGTQVVDKYVADIILPNKVTISNVTVLGSPALAGFDLIIGMDVITLGDFCITNKDGKTVVSFRIPSEVKTDYAAEINARKIKLLKSLGRNAKCPCNSGLKVKDCCGKGIV